MPVILAGADWPRNLSSSVLKQQISQTHQEPQDPAEQIDSGLVRLTGEGTPLRSGDVIAFFGDSVTMQGGYLDLMNKALQSATAPQARDIRLLRHGLNGGRVPTVLEGKSPWGDLGGTMQSLLERERPSLVVIYLGINDVWHGDKGTSPEDYRSGLLTMLDLCRAIQATPLLCTPTIIGEEVDGNAMNEKLGDYAEIVRQLGKAQQVEVCDLHRAFIDTLRRKNKANAHQGTLTYDGVHMNDQGNALLAECLALGILGTLERRNGADSK